MSEKIEFSCLLKENKYISENHIVLTIHAPEITQQAQPGQFVNLAAGSFLRRPFGIMSVDKRRGDFSIGIEIKGQGTRYLADLKAGSELSILGPLGKGFDLSSYNRVITVGGGTGVYPLLFVQEYCREHNLEGIAVCGYRSAAESVLIDEFTQTACAVSFASDAGDLAISGHAAKAFELTIADLEEQKKDLSKTLVATCGPKLLMQAVAAIAQKKNLDCQVSLEERMACGIGICLVCACKTIDQAGQEEHSRCCVEGPVFPAEVVVW